jgi:CRP-like cAMP-binding protein
MHASESHPDLQARFVQHFSRISPLSAEEAQAIRESMLCMRFKRGEFLLREGQISIDTYFVLQGCIRQYSLVDGEEKTTDFFTEDQWAISLNGLANFQAAIYNWVAHEDTVVAMGNETQAQAMFQRFPRFETISRQVMEAVFVAQQHKMTSFMTDTPEQRYLKLIAERPNLVQRIPQYQLASYIGIKPESLSRLRKRLAKGGEQRLP